MLSSEPMLLFPHYRDYVWGGDRLRPGHAPPAEAWVVYAEDIIASGPLAGLRLAQAADQNGEDLLGKRALKKTGLRFPLLVKLLDCAAWLSLQVHPNDEMARKLEGPGFFGKTEAWHFIDAVENAEILCGIRPGTETSEVADALLHGKLLPFMQRLSVAPGSSIFIAPGTIHALGPGLLVYEVQQTSDLTYRVWDWDRPATAARPLHIEKSLAVYNPNSTGNLLPPPPKAEDGSCQNLITCDYFSLDLLVAETKPIALDTERESFHAITVIEGCGRLIGSGWSLDLDRFASTLVPAAAGAYTFLPCGASRALKASV